MAKSRTSLGTGSLSGRFIESLFRLKNPNQSLPTAQQHRQLGDVGGDALGRRPLAARPRASDADRPVRVYARSRT